MTTNVPGVAFVNLGCRVNRVEVDLFARRLEESGLDVVGLDEADLVVLNTCAVTGEAQAKTRKAVRRALAQPRAPWVLATGCVASLFADELLALGPKVVVVPNKSEVVGRALRLLRWEPADGVGTLLAHGLTPTGRMRPGVKIQDGCDNRCSFCIVWQARGPSRSLPSADVRAAVREAVAGGAHEVVLTGINLGSWRAGDDDVLPAGARLDALLAHLLETTDMERIRISSIEPPDVTDELLEVMSSSEGRVAPFLHVCLQSGCDATLRRMRRVYTTEDFRVLVAHARQRMPKVALGTDLIVGFPGETDEEFEESLAFCQDVGFARMHVFRYSRRPGTPAAAASDQVSPRVVAERAARMHGLAEQMRRDHMSLLDGDEDALLVLSAGRAVGGHLHDVRVDRGLAPGSFVRLRLHCEDGALCAR